MTKRIHALVMLIVILLTVTPFSAGVLAAPPPAPVAIASPAASPTTHKVFFTATDDRDYVSSMATWLTVYQTSWTPFVRLHAYADLTSTSWNDRAKAALELWDGPMVLLKAPPAQTNFTEWDAALHQQIDTLLNTIRPSFSKAIADKDTDAYTSAWSVFSDFQTASQKLLISLVQIPTSLPGDPVEHSLGGYMDLTDTSGTTGWTLGYPCAGSGGFSDISENSQVTVKDQNSAIVAIGDVVQTLASASNECLLIFVAVGIPADASFISVEFSHRGDLNFSRAELDDAGWFIGFTLGH